MTHVGGIRLRSVAGRPACGAPPLSFILTKADTGAAMPDGDPPAFRIRSLAGMLVSGRGALWLPGLRQHFRDEVLVSMLVRFKSEVGGFVMFGDVATKLLRMAGHSATVPGAIGADDMAQALARLEAQVLAQTPTAKEATAEGPAGQAGGDEDKDAEPVVSLAQRAFPMIELMRRAVAEQCAIQWRED